MTNIEHNQETIEAMVQQLQSANALAERAVRIAQQQAQAADTYRKAYEGLVQTTIRQQLIDALQAQGGHQKQQALWLLAKTLDIDLSDIEIIEQRLCTVERPLPMYLSLQRNKIADDVYKQLSEQTTYIAMSPSYILSTANRDRWHVIRFSEKVLIEQIDPRTLVTTIGYTSRFEQDEAIFYDRTFRITLPAESFPMIYIDMQDKALSLLLREGGVTVQEEQQTKDKVVYRVARKL